MIVERRDDASSARVRHTVKTRTKAKSIHEAKDELEFATNWKRSFLDLYKQLKWLNAYAQLNEVACAKILKKFMKNTFEIKDNIIDKNLSDYMKQSKFSNRKLLHCAIDDMLTFFAEHFTGTKTEARYVLEQYTTSTRPKDTIGVSLFGGMAFLLTVISVFLGLTPSSDGTRSFFIEYAAISLIKLTFMLVFIVFASAFCT